MTNKINSRIQKIVRNNSQNCVQMGVDMMSKGYL